MADSFPAIAGGEDSNSRLESDRSAIRWQKIRSGSTGWESARLADSATDEHSGRRLVSGCHNPSDWHSDSGCSSLNGEQ